MSETTGELVLNEALEGYMGAITQNCKTYQARLAEIQADANLSSMGKHAAAVELHRKAMAKHDELQAAYNAEVEATREILRQAAFTPRFGYLTDQATKVATRAAYAAALDRAANMTGEQLRAAMERARLSGDDVSAQAIAHIAWEKGAGDVLEAYMEGDRGGDLKRLQDFEEAYGERRSVDRKFAQRVAFTKPQYPTL